MNRTLDDITKKSDEIVKMLEDGAGKGDRSIFLFIFGRDIFDYNKRIEKTSQKDINEFYELLLYMEHYLWTGEMTMEEES